MLPLILVTINRDDLDPATRRRFRSGRACLDFAHTGGVGAWVQHELLHTGEDLERWLALVLDADAIAATAADVAPARTLRQAIWELAQARIAGAAAPVDVVNGFARGATLAPQLHQGLHGTGAEALGTLARDAVDLFGGPLAGRVRECAADDCGLLFVDTSRPGGRRWCSMERCGARAKMRTYRDAARS